MSRVLLLINVIVLLAAEGAADSGASASGLVSQLKLEFDFQQQQYNNKHYCPVIVIIDIE